MFVDPVKANIKQMRQTSVTVQRNMHNIFVLIVSIGYRLTVQIVRSVMVQYHGIHSIKQMDIKRFYFCYPIPEWAYCIYAHSMESRYWPNVSDFRCIQIDICAFHSHIWFRFVYSDELTNSEWKWLNWPLLNDYYKTLLYFSLENIT